MMKINLNLTNKLLQIEIIKKATNINEAISIGLKDIKSSQSLDKTITNKEEKAFVKGFKKEITPEEKAESEWTNED